MGDFVNIVPWDSEHKQGGQMLSLYSSELNEI